MSTDTMSAPPVITQEMVDRGDVFVEVIPMLRGHDGDTVAEYYQEPDYYDVLLRPDAFTGPQDDVFEEWEDLDWSAVNDRVAALERQYPGIGVNWVNN